MHARFLAAGAYTTGDTIALPDEEAQHAVRVLRLTTGSAIRVFNGAGDEFDATITHATRSAVSVVVGAPHAAAPEPRVAVTLAQAVLKGDKMDDVVRDAVMMGVAAIQPIVTARTEVSLATLQRGNRRDRWQRVAASSVKQCGRAVVPRIADPVMFEPGAGHYMLVEPSATPAAVGLSELDAARPAAVTIVIGPEGGWTADEIAQASAASRLVTLGGRTLRADAMATVAISALFAIWKEF